MIIKDTGLSSTITDEGNDLLAKIQVAKKAILTLSASLTNPASNFYDILSLAPNNLYSDYTTALTGLSISLSTYIRDLPTIISDNTITEDNISEINEFLLTVPVIMQSLTDYQAQLNSFVSAGYIMNNGVLVPLSTPPNLVANYDFSSGTPTVVVAPETPQVVGQPERTSTTPAIPDEAQQLINNGVIEAQQNPLIVVSIGIGLLKLFKIF